MENFAIHEPELMGIAEFARRAGGLCPWTVRKKIQAGELRSVKVWGRRMIPIAELRRALDGELGNAKPTAAQKLNDRKG